MFASGTLIGLDIGHHALRAVALRRVGRDYHVVGHAMVHRRDDSGEPRGMAAALGELDSMLRISVPPCLAIGDLAALVRYVSTIPLPPDRLNRLLRLELLQHMEGGELAADTFAVPLVGDELIHCCVLAQPAQVHAALSELAAAGITAGPIHFAPVAVYNATLLAPPVHDEELALLVDIGSTSTGVTLLGEGRLLACRQLAIGGDAFTEALAVAGGVPATQAEAMKVMERDGHAPSSRPVERPEPPTSAVPSLFADDGDDDLPLVLADESATDADGPLTLDADSRAAFEAAETIGAFDDVTETLPETGSSSGLLSMIDDDVVPHTELGPSKPGLATLAVGAHNLGPELTKVAEALYTQLASSMAWFKTQIHARNVGVVKVLLAGGGAGLPGLDTYLARRFGVPVQRFDPFAGLEGEAPARPHEFAVAVGLALSTAPGGMRLDLMPDELLRRQAWRQRLLWPYVAAASLLLAALLIGWTLLDEQAVDRDSLAAYAAYQKSYDDLKGQLDAFDHEREDLSEDLRAIASRIYAGRDLLYTVRALKERTAKSPELWVTRLATVDISQDAGVKDPTTATSRRIQSGASMGSKDARHDTAIDRGAVDVSGLVKFDASPSDIELNRFFEDYKEWLLAWQPSTEAPPLFRDVKVLRHIIQHEDKNEKGKPIPVRDKTEAGHFPFLLRYFFQPTRLDTVTVQRTATVEAQPKPAHHAP